MSAAALLGAAAQVTVFGLTGWVFGGVLLRALRAGDGRPDAAVSWPERALLALVGGVALAVALTVAHLVTGGAVFGVPGVVPMACLAVVWYGWRRSLLPGGIPWARALSAAAALLLVYAGPTLATGSGLRTGDIPWHMGWTEQLLGGEPVPTGPAPGFGANAYPWGFHAVLATLVRAVPGTSTALAVDAVGFLLVLAIPLSAACLARRIRADAGWWAAGASSCIGGLGWLGTRDVRFVTSPSEAAFGADLVVASPNAVYELLPPALPRELGLALLAGAGTLLLLAGARRARSTMVAGVATGLVGLVSLPLVVSAWLWAVVTGAGGPRPGRARRAGGALLAGVAVLALWAAPVVADHVAYGGFVDVTPRLGREWPLPSALGSWGLLLPLAAAGLVLAARAGWGGRMLVAWTLVTCTLLALARLRGELEWDLGGNATLLHQGRVWPVAHLLAAALGGVALAGLWRSLARRSALAAVGAGVVILAVGAVSPVLAARDLARTMARGDDGYLYASGEAAPGRFVRRAAAHLDPSDVVVVEGRRAHELALVLWQFSGARLASFDDPRLARNDLRIRFTDLAEAWDRRVAGRGFDPSVVVAAPGARPPGQVVERGRFRGRAWVMVRP